MKSVKWFSFAAGVLFGSGSSLAVVASAESGDLLYEAPGQEKCITAPQALCFADCAIAAESWDGAASDMISTTAERTKACASGFSATTRGLKSSAPGDLPVTANGVKVLGVVE